MSEDQIKEMIKALDPASAGYFTVTDRKPATDGREFFVKGYDVYENLLLHTWHKNWNSMLMEVDAWRNRGAQPKGEDAERASATVDEFERRRKAIYGA